MRELWRRLRFLRHRAEFERDLEEEMRFHLEMTSRRQFGNVARLKEESRAMWGWSALEELAQDVRYGLRQLAAKPGFTAVAALSLALGIGANTAIFSLMDRVMLRRLPVEKPEELMVTRRIISYPRFEELRRRNAIFSQMAGVHLLRDLQVKDKGLVTGELVSGTYFGALGVKAAAGRTLLPEDDASPEHSPVAVISYGYWQRAFGGAPDVLGRKIQVKSGRTDGGTSGLDVYDKGTLHSPDGAVVTIVGVAPPEFFGDTVGVATDVWIPITMQPAVMPGRPFLAQRNATWVQILGRLRPGITQEQAAAALLSTWRQMLTDEEGAKLTEARRQEIARSTINGEPGEKGFSELRREFSQPLTVLMAVVALVLLIACLNVANLLMARATARKREIGLRLSLGAGRMRIVRQLVTESLMLAGLGGALGIAMAYAGTRVLLLLLSGSGLRLAIGFDADARTLGFLAAISVAAALIFGVVPAMRATRVSLAETLKESGRGGSARGGATKMLVGAQVAVSMLLLIGAALFVRTLHNLKSQNVGYNPERLVIMRVDPVGAGYRGDQVGRAMMALLGRIRELPGVRTATFSENGLFSGTESGDRVDVEGFTPRSAEDRSARFDQIGPEYFTNIGVPILLGRDISERDVPGATRVAVINETMAKFYFPGGNPIGRYFTASDTRLEIVGVARDLQDHDFRDAPVRRFYVSYLQPIDGITTANFEVRTAGDAAGLAGELRQAVAAVSPSLQVLGIKDVRQLMDASVVQEQLVAKLASFFGVLAMLLAAIGLYGVMSYAVARKTNEIGIRIALGARSGGVIAMVLGEVAILIAGGAVGGMAVAAIASRWVKTLLFGLPAVDVVSFGAAAGLLLVTGALAAYLPARRASRIDPVIALRCE